MYPFAFSRPDEDTHDLSIFGCFCYYLTNSIALPISYSLILMNLNTIVQLYNNLTTLERFKMHTTKIPCYGPTNENMTTPNEYDMLWLPNFKQVMGSRMWMWPLPFINEEMKGQGFFYPKIPEITLSDINMLVGKDHSKQQTASFTNNDFDSDPNQYIEKALKKYGGKTFTISPGVEGG
jgi:hypothetical protein